MRPLATRLTEADLLAGYQHESHDDCHGWLGFGYLGERALARDSSDAEVPAVPEKQLLRVDAVILAHANRQGWTGHELFDWLNSRDGRHWADLWLRSDEPERGVYQIERIPDDGSTPTGWPMD